MYYINACLGETNFKLVGSRNGSVSHLGSHASLFLFVVCMSVVLILIYVYY